MPTFDIDQAGRSVDSILSDLKATTLTNSDKGVLVASWIFQNFGNVQRTFNYGEVFADDDPACKAAFTPSFAHADWTDGESVVQAGETPGEKGFNFRFHAIETDFREMAKDVAEAFLCLKQVRKALHDRLEEVRAELNRINAAVFKLQGNTGPVPTGVLTAKPPFGTLLDASQFLGTTPFLKTKVNVWNTPQGVLILPTVDAAGLDPVNRDRLNAAPALNRFILEKPPQELVLPTPFTKEAFTAKFGDQVLSDGQRVRDVVDILQDGSQFTSIDALVGAVAERQAAAVRTSGASVAVLTHVLAGASEAPGGAAGGAGAVVAAPDVSVRDVAAIPPEMRTALVNAGVRSVADLSNKSADEIAKIATDNHLNVTRGQAAEWNGLARTIRSIR